MSRSKIEWTQSTWNPVTGCEKISEGCRNCYAERMAKRLQAMGQEKYLNGFRVTCHPHVLETPLGWKKPRTVFVNSMSDLFHQDVPDDFIFDIFDVMKRAHWHNFQALTKRSERMAELSERLEIPPNVWMGVTVESESCKSRIEDLKRVPASVRFLSMEPLLGGFQKLNLDHIDWIIVGGESGPGCRPMREEWALNIREQCRENGVRFFFKQWGGTNKKKAGRILEGRTWDSMPVPVFA
ncbi:Bacteriophage protein gp37 [Candidatus Desulfarcum epimagneticum]|uniref:Bacteriophage protein gp37 n=1 Tax=uncultured Desulfobacteraceae bacterium TaxID=218296 RepID=A0A484HJH4_9BACT|nr:Bacteriophage protein gp37 [uncultured Desulfobacteraceae bacterium]